MKIITTIVVAIILICIVILVWCICAVSPREPWEDEEQIKYVDDWIRNKTK